MIRRSVTRPRTAKEDVRMTLTRSSLMKRWLSLLVLPLLTACGYNRIQTLDEPANTAQNQIEVQPQRRAALIPNPARPRKGYAQHEEEVFIKVAEARSGLVQAIQTHDAEQ